MGASLTRVCSSTVLASFHPLLFLPLFFLGDCQQEELQRALLLRTDLATPVHPLLIVTAALDIIWL